MTFLALFAAILGGSWLLFMAAQALRGARLTCSSGFNTAVAAALLSAGLLGLGVLS